MASYALIETVYEDEYLLAVNKPAGLLVHRSTANAVSTINSPAKGDKNQNAIAVLRSRFGDDIEGTSNDTVFDFLLSLDHFAGPARGTECRGFSVLRCSQARGAAYCLGDRVVPLVISFLF